METSIEDFALIMDIIKNVIQYQFPVFGFHISLESAFVGSEIAVLFIEALVNVFD